jgi:hypothetical protein
MSRTRGDIMAEPRANESLAELIRDAIGDAKDWLRAEIALIRAQFIEALGSYAGAAIAWAAAGVLALLALVYLGFALALALTPYLGDAGAALAVGLIFLCAAVAAFFYGRTKFRQAKIVPPRLSEALTDSAPASRKADL